MCTSVSSSTGPTITEAKTLHPQLINQEAKNVTSRSIVYDRRPIIRRGIQIYQCESYELGTYLR